MSGNSLPWISGDLEIEKSVMDEIERHSLEDYPSESCGFVFGPADQPALLDSLQREENEADKYHKLDPITFPRTSNTYFKINELRAARTFEKGQNDRRPVKVIYHSHCDAGAYFSSAVDIFLRASLGPALNLVLTFSRHRFHGLHG